MMRMPTPVRAPQLAIALAALLSLGSGCALGYTSAGSIDQAEVASLEIPEDRLIEVAIDEFDPGVSAEQGEDDWAARPEVRNGEARYMPFQLKQTLQQSGYWGSVWVTPRPSEAAGLRVRGSIGNSDGQFVKLEIEATDVTGRTWLADTYRISLDPKDYVESTGDPYQPIFSQIANDLLEARRLLSDDELREIRLVSELRFAEDLSPDAFKGYLAEKNGRYTVKRLPARDDPMLDRVRELRDREFLFLDTLNDHYAAFHREMATPYRNWRELAREESEALSEVRKSAALRALGGAALIAVGVLAGSADSAAADVLGDLILGGGVLVGASAYSRYQETKMHESALNELSASFGSEVAPLVVQVDDQTIRLTGSADQQYEQWRALLRELYAAESGLIDVYAEPMAELPTAPITPEAAGTTTVPAAAGSQPSQAGAPDTSQAEVLAP